MNKEMKYSEQNRDKSNQQKRLNLQTHKEQSSQQHREYDKEHKKDNAQTA